MKVLLILFMYLFSISDEKRGFGEGDQEWGYVMVRPGAHMFWWLYFTTAHVNESYYEKPLLIWLQGGPGQSSTGYGNFMELGPLGIDMKPRNHTWIKDYNVLFIDSPVGSGFSYVEWHAKYSETNTEIATDLLTFIIEFYNIFPDFSDTRTYIVSESYGGKTTIEFARIWYKEQVGGAIKSNLRGVALGSPWISPIDSIMEYAPYLLNMGLIDRRGYNKVIKRSLIIKKAVEEENWLEAARELDIMEAAIFAETNNVNIFNVLSKLKSNVTNVGMSGYDDYRDSVNLLAYFMNTVVKQELNIDIYWGHTATVINKMLRADYMKPVVKQVESLLNETDIKVYVFNGLLDLAVNTNGTFKWMKRLRWDNASNWRYANRNEMIIDGVIQGYVKQYDKLKMFWINRAGHMATIDNPAAVFAILRDLTENS